MGSSADFGWGLGRRGQHQAEGFGGLRGADIVSGADWARAPGAPVGAPGSVSAFRHRPGWRRWGRCPFVGTGPLGGGENRAKAPYILVCPRASRGVPTGSG